MSAGPATARDALTGWLQHLSHERRASPRTLEAYGDGVRRYLDFLEQHRGGALALSDLGEISDAALSTLLYGCGLRISEGLSLKRRDVPLGASLRVLGKGSKTRIAPVLPAVAEAMAAYVAVLPFVLDPDEPVFRARRGGPFSAR